MNTIRVRELLNELIKAGPACLDSYVYIAEVPDREHTYHNSGENRFYIDPRSVLHAPEDGD